MYKHHPTDLLFLSLTYHLQTSKMFLILMGVMIVMVVITILMPQMSGLTTYTKNPDYIKKQNEKKETKAKRSDEFELQEQQQYTYEAPDADIDGDEALASKNSSRFTGVRSALNKIAHPNLTESDIPIKLELVGESELKRRARSNKDVGNKVSSDSNNFDFNIDEFIEEENKKDELEYLEEAQKRYGSAEV